MFMTQLALKVRPASGLEDDARVTVNEAQ